MTRADVSVESLLDLNGKAAVITGAGSSFGRELSIIFCQLGVRVVIVDISVALAEETANLCTSAVPDARVLVCNGDVSKPELNDAAVEACVKQFGSCDIFWANAGIHGTAVEQGQNELIGSTPERWHQVMSVNLDGVFFGYQASARQMMKQETGGSIIATASIAGVMAGAGPLPYSVSKAGVIQLTQTAARALTGKNIQVNCICPGLIASNLTLGATEIGFQDSQTRKFLDAHIWQTFRNPLLRYGKLSEVASVALFLASRMSSFVNGQAIAVDGGQTAVYNISDYDENFQRRHIPSFYSAQEEYRASAGSKAKL